MVKIISLFVVLLDMDECNSEVVDFGVYMGIAKKINESNKTDIISSESIRLVTKEKDFFDPYPWISPRLKSIGHPLDPSSTTQKTKCNSGYFLLCDRCPSYLYTVDEACNEELGSCVRLSACICMFVFILLILSSISGSLLSPK